MTVSDGTNEDSQAIMVNISNVYDFSPVITSVDSFSLDENQTYVGKVTATEGDAGALTYSISGVDSSMLNIVAIGSNSPDGRSTGEISFDDHYNSLGTDPPDFENPGDEDKAVSYTHLTLPTKA